MTTGEMRVFIEESIRPRIQGDGGEIRFVSLSDGTLTVKLMGECAVCPVAEGRLSDWLAECIRKRFGTEVAIRTIMVKPYFKDV